MKTIYKYELEPSRYHRISMPEGAEILTVQMQGEIACLWALADDAEPNSSRVFVLWGTGSMLPTTPIKYIGTIQLHRGEQVFHVFEVQE